MSLMIMGCVTNMLSDLNRRHSQLSMMYKIYNNLVDVNAGRIIHSSDARTRGQHRLFQERTTDQVLANSYFPRTIQEWNILPARTVAAPILDAFRSLLVE